ncbi:UL16-binding protein 3-like [Saccopteryx leptura]|uniref:UL16-binding protein 3-like n=1 Tax=Saccopteryx leptura TaxID=249018 RepID=UPI00339BC57A
MLGEMGQELRMILPDIKLETRTRGPRTLQAKLCCQQEAGQYTGASWEFSFNGQPALLLDTKHKKWTVIDPAANGTKEDWEKNKELAEYFRKTSMGDCNRWLGEFLEPMEKVREPTELSTPLGPLREKVNATNAQTEFPQTQGERAREHSMNLSDVSLEKNRTRDTPQPSNSWSTESIIGISFAVISTIIIGAGIISFVRKRRRSGTMKAIPSSDASSLDHDTEAELNEP